MKNGTMYFFTSSLNPEKIGFLSYSEDDAPILDIQQHKTNILEDLGLGSFTLEFIVQALPCYIFLGTFIVRNK